MLKKYMLSVLLGACILSGFNQTGAALSAPSALEQADTLLEKAYQNVLSQGDVFTNSSGTKPWQMALFLSAHERDLQSLFQQIHTQMRAGYLSVAAVLYLPPAKQTPSSSYSLYIFYPDPGNNGVRQEKQIIPASTSALLLWETLLKHFSRHPDFYTGILAEAHSHDTGFFYAKTYFTSQQITQAVISQHLHVDVMELHSCHASSLYNLYHWARGARIDYLVASSNLSVTDERFFANLLQFLNYSPAKAAVLSTQDRLKQLRFSASAPTNSVVALNLKVLQHPLLEYVRLYNELLSYDQSDAFEEAFESFFQSRDELKKLRDMVLKQRAFVRAHLVSPQLKAFYQAQTQFINACDTLLQAINRATMKRWCYSQKDRHVYVYNGQSSCASGCLDSVNVSLGQYRELRQ